MKAQDLKYLSQEAKQKIYQSIHSATVRSEEKKITVAFSAANISSNINGQEHYVFGPLLAPFPSSHCCSGPKALDFCFPDGGFSSVS